MTNEEILSDFMRLNYSDERLSWLLAHAEAGVLSYMSCCCFIGVANADHALRGLGEFEDDSDLDDFNLGHYDRAGFLPGADEAEAAYAHLSGLDSERRAKLIPLIRAEIERREKERSSSIQSEAGERVGVTV